jgi:hypothetical protein
MVTFRNNTNRRNNFKRNDKNFKLINDRNKLGSGFSNNENFQRKSPGRNNHNASKLIEKYNNLAREALSTGDKILSENYFQHADHFTRVLTDQENLKKNRLSNNKINNHNMTEEKDLNNDQTFKDETCKEKKIETLELKKDAPNAS